MAVKFERRKSDQLKRKDKSSKQKWDKKIMGLCEALNNDQDYYTTSSCSGRILLLKNEEKKQPGLFLKVWHSCIKTKDLEKALNKIIKIPEQTIYFKQEPAILHIAARDISSAQNLINIAKSSGWKKCGIIASKSRYVVELANTEKLEFPIADRGKLLVSKALLQKITEESGKKLKKSWDKIERLKKQLQNKSNINYAIE
jgi:tRNA wybutosine-synthesizing protein 3